MGMGICGMGLLSTIIVAPIVLSLEIPAFVCSVLGVNRKFIGQRLLVKAKKHKIRILAESKLNMVMDHVSHALMDGQISEEEFLLIMYEVDQMKAEILDEETKKKNHSVGQRRSPGQLHKKVANCTVMYSCGLAARGVRYSICSENKHNMPI